MYAYYEVRTANGEWIYNLCFKCATILVQNFRPILHEIDIEIVMIDPDDGDISVSCEGCDKLLT